MLFSRTVRRQIAALSVIVGLTACDGCGAATPPRADRVATELRVSEPRPSVTPDRRTIEESTGARYELLRFRFSLASTTISVIDLEFETTLRDALEGGEGGEADVVLAINGGYWDTALAPEGLTRVAGQELAPLSDTLGGGVLVIDDGMAQLLDAESEDLDVPVDVDFAQQCMPRIVVDGALNINRDDGRHADRTALCIRDGGRTLDVYVARGEAPDGHGGPTLWTFGEVLVEEECEAALNLDGGGSTGAVWRGPNRIERLPPRVPLRLALLFE